MWYIGLAKKNGTVKTTRPETSKSRIILPFLGLLNDLEKKELQVYSCTELSFVGNPKYIHLSICTKCLTPIVFSVCINPDTTFPVILSMHVQIQNDLEFNILK